MTRALHLAAILCIAIITAAGWAHLMALPNKIGMSAEHYFIVQQIYRGWALSGVVEFAALALAVILAWRYRGSGTPYRLTLLAIASIAAGLAIFFCFTFPANQATANWTVVPSDWRVLRARWEYSHAAAAILDFVALASLAFAALPVPRSPVSDRRPAAE